MPNYNLTDDNLLSMSITALSAKKFATTGYESEGTSKYTRDERVSNAKSVMTATLPLPSALVFPTELDWSIEESSLLQHFGGNTGLHTLANMTDGDMQDAIAAVKNRAIDAATAGFGSDIRRQLRGQAKNPYKTTFFNGSNNRTYNYVWIFAPKNAIEADNIRSFYESVDSSALPSVGNDTYFGIPDTFQVNFDERLKIPTVAECVCNSVEIDFTPAGLRFHEDGHPVFIQVSMQLTENGVPTSGSAR